MQPNALPIETKHQASYSPFYTYRAYGLTIESEFRLPELSPADGDGEVVIHKGAIEQFPSEASGQYSFYKATERGIYLAWADVGKFLIKDGREMVVDPLPGVEERIVRLFILGTALAMLLHQRQNMIVLHAGVVDVSGVAVAFVGEKGAGKSTLAGTFHRLGHNLIADDILAVRVNPGRIEAVPGFPHLKLWPDSLESMGFTAMQMPKLRPELEKRSFCIKEGFSDQPLPLSGIYLLDDGVERSIQKLESQSALMALMPHWYGARFGEEFLKSLGLSVHFQQCVRLVNATTIYRLTRPRSLGQVEAVAQFIVDHVQERNLRKQGS